MKCIPVLMFASLLLPTFTAAQSVDSADPGFTLTLSRGRHGGEFSKDTQVMVVRLTNTSKGINYEDTCSAFGGLYRLLVVYNGVPVEEPAAKQKERKASESGLCFGGSGSNPARHLKPGEHRDDFLYYETKNPGTYEFTVERISIPGEPDKSVIVKSNSLTIVVPSPDDSSAPPQ